MAPGRGRRSDRAVDIFISYTPADERWATWMAWQLEVAGFRTLLQAWDFVPGTKFIDFMDRGVSEARVVLALLSPAYLDSTYGRMEWQAALRAAPDNPATKLVTIRIAECTLEGLLATITYVDLVRVADPDEARELLLTRVRQALAGSARPAIAPDFPLGPGRAGGFAAALAEPAGRPRRRPVVAPTYPPATPAANRQRGEISVLHVAAPRFGRGRVAEGDPVTPAELQERIYRDLTQLAAAGVPHPDLVVVTGDLTESGARGECEQALDFLVGLRVLLGLEVDRLAVVPGSHDVTRPACRAYFDLCDTDGIEPQPPYAPKWRHFMPLFDELYRGLDGPIFDDGQPWTLFAVPGLQLVIAGLNSTIAETHLDADRYGLIGDTQAAWFARHLAPFEGAGWFRLGLVAHLPVPVPVAEVPAHAALRDTHVLDKLLGRRLNVLLTGQSPPGALADPLVSGLPVLPMPGRSTYQLLVLTPGGVRRHHPDGLGDDPSAAEQLVERSWHGSGQTFAAADSAPVAIAAEARPDPVDSGRVLAVTDPSDPAERLIERIVEACRIKYDRAEIRSAESDPPHLRLTYSDDGFPRRLRIAAYVGTPTVDDVDRFIRQVHAADPEIASELVYDGRPPPRSVRDEAARRGVRVLSFVEFQGLLDLRDYVAAQTTALQASDLYPPELYVPQRFRYLVGADQLVHDDVVDELLELLAGDDGRFVLILGEFGRGKTFALREVARRIATGESAALQRLIPVFIELRSLDKAHSVDGLVAAHLANHGQDRIDLKAFRYMRRQGRIVLLFDGFDELVGRLSYDRAADHLETLLQAVEGDAKVVVTSRRQHFRTDSQVLTALGERVGLLPHRQVLHLEDFTVAQIRRYLVNRYGDERAADVRMTLLRGVEDLLGLSRNPRMLSFIAGLETERLRAVASAGQAISPATLYQEILQAWLAYEVRRAHGVPGTPSGLAEGDLWEAVTALALRVWDSGEPLLSLSELTEVAGTLTSLGEVELSREQAAYAVGSGSLLLRTDDGRFGFIHSSVPEWLVARHVAAEFAAGVAHPAALSRRPLSQLTTDFVVDLADPRRAERWAEEVLGSPETSDVERANALRVSRRLKVPVSADLRGASLRGEDLSYRDFSRVDLTGADLTDARLVATNLADATLRRAKLVGARLDQTNLRGADLGGADLTRARLLRADLTGARVDGSTWRQTALVDVTAGPELFAAREVADAAVAPGQPVLGMIAPAAVGVSFGFETGRIAEPAAYSPGGGTVAIGSDDGAVLLCDAGTGLVVRTLHGHTGRVYAVAYGPDDTVLATGSDDDTVRLWHPGTGEPLRVLRGHADWVWPMVLDAAGARLLAGDSSGTVRLWDTGTGALVARLPGHARRVWSAAFSPDGTLVATADAKGQIRIFDAGSGALRQSFAGHAGSTYRLAFHPDGALLFSAGDDRLVRLWRVADGRLVHEMAGHAGRVYCVAIHPAGDLVATGDTAGSVRLWRIGADGTEVTGHGLSRPHRGAVYSVQFSADGGRLATADSDGVVRLWHGRTGQFELELTGHRGSVWPVRFRADGAQLLTSSTDATTRLWDTATGRCRAVFRGHGRRVGAVAFSPDGTALAASTNDGVVRLWSPRTGQRLRDLRGSTDRLVSAIFSPVAAILATASGDGTIHLWNTDTGADERELNVETDYVWAAAFSTDGDVLATANDDDSVRLWIRSTGRRVLVLPDHRGRVRAISFSPDGRSVATGCDDSLVRIWARGTGELTGLLDQHTDRVYAVTYSPDGSVLASASNDGTAVLWDTATRRARHELRPGTGRLWTAAFAPDGTVLATGGDDLLIRVWDVATGALRAELAGHTRRISSVAFSPDGTLLASGADDGTVRLWDLTDRTAPKLRSTLVSLGDAWAALAPDGRYKTGGDVAGQVWHAVGTCRFELGELTPYLPPVRPIALDAEF